MWPMETLKIMESATLIINAKVCENFAFLQCIMAYEAGYICKYIPEALDRTSVQACRSSSLDELASNLLQFVLPCGLFNVARCNFLFILKRCPRTPPGYTPSGDYFFDLCVRFAFTLYFRARPHTTVHGRGWDGEWGRSCWSTRSHLSFLFRKSSLVAASYFSNRKLICVRIFVVLSGESSLKKLNTFTGLGSEWLYACTFCFGITFCADITDAIIVFR